MRFRALLVSTFAATTVSTPALAQHLPQLDVVLPGHRLVVSSSASRVRVCGPESPDQRRSR